MTATDAEKAATWQANGDPFALLSHLRRRHRIASRKGCQRKLRLLGCAAARLVWEFLPDGPRRAVEAAELHAAKEARRQALRSAGEAAAADTRPGGPIQALGDFFYPLLDAFGWSDPVRARRLDGQELAMQLTQPVFGITRAEFVLAAVRRVMTAHNRTEADALVALAGRVREQYGNPYCMPLVRPEWRTSAARGLAAAAADGAFDRLPILADALEEAGCDDSFLLAHLRGDVAAHARGCWAADAVLGHLSLAGEPTDTA